MNNINYGWTRRLGSIPHRHTSIATFADVAVASTRTTWIYYFFSFSRRTQQTDDGRSLFLLRRLYLLLLFLILCVPNHLCDRIHVVKGSSQDGMKFTRIVYTYVWYVSGEQANTFPSHPIGIVRCDYYTAGWANHLASPTPSISSRSHNANAGYLSK